MFPPSNDVYRWLRVVLTVVDDDTVDLELPNSGKTMKGVFFNWAEQFDPEKIWYSYYPDPCGDVVRRPGNAGDKSEGYLLLKADLPEVVAEAGVAPMSPKWPRGLGA